VPAQHLAGVDASTSDAKLNVLPPQALTNEAMVEGFVPMQVLRPTPQP